MSEAPTRRVEVARKDSVVILAINCTSDYAAMLLYDEIAKELKEGYVAIELSMAVPVSGSEK